MQYLEFLHSLKSDPIGALPHPTGYTRVCRGLKEQMGIFKTIDVNAGGKTS
jgi:hypothetical protein